MPCTGNVYVYKFGVSGVCMQMCPSHARTHMYEKGQKKRGKKKPFYFLKNVYTYTRFRFP